MNINPFFKNISFAAIISLAFTIAARAVDPPPDGGYPNFNTAEGDNALLNLTTGAENTAIGFNTLFNNTTGFRNTALGTSALTSNTTGDSNTALGWFTLLSNTTGTGNTAAGLDALSRNTTGISNTATGLEALAFNTGGFFNTATGVSALNMNTDGYDNTGDGVSALFNNTSGIDNTAVGWDAASGNTTGNFNTAVGRSALGGNSTGSSNIAVGSFAGSLITGSTNIDIGNMGVAGESKTIRLGTRTTHKSTYIAGISGVTVPTGIPVIIDPSGHLGTTTSSARYKENIQPMNDRSEAILSLRPVVFRYKKEFDPKAVPQFGLVAEQVEKVDPDLVARDDEGKPYSVRYDEINAMLLNEFLKEHRKVEEQVHLNQEQEATIIEVKSSLVKQETLIAKQQEAIQTLTRILREQAAQIQKVGQQLHPANSALLVSDDD